MPIVEYLGDFHATAVTAFSESSTMRWTVRRKKPKLAYAELRMSINLQLSWQ